MWASMFQNQRTDASRLIHDILNVVKDILLIINAFYHSTVIEWLIDAIPNPQTEQNNRPIL